MLAIELNRAAEYQPGRKLVGIAGAMVALVLALQPLNVTAEDPKPVPSSYDQIAPALQGKLSFAEQMAADKADKPAVIAKHKKLLTERYDLTPRPDKAVKMTRGKPIPVGPTAKLAEGTTWESLAGMTPSCPLTR